MSDVLDPAAAARLRRLGGDRLLREMTELFLQLGEERLAAAGSGDRQEAERACHSLKSSAGNLGAHVLQQAAAQAEQTAAGDDRAAHDMALARLADAYGAAARALRQLLQETAS